MAATGRWGVPARPVPGAGPVLPAGAARGQRGKQSRGGGRGRDVSLSREGKGGVSPTLGTSPQQLQQHSPVQKGAEGGFSTGHHTRSESTTTTTLH